MSVLQAIQEHIKQLSPIERQEFREWFVEWECNEFNLQMEYNVCQKINRGLEDVASEITI